MNNLPQTTSKKQKNDTRQDFLLSFFLPHTTYKEKHLNGFWLVKHPVNGGIYYEVAIYSEESFRKYKEYLKLKKLEAKQPSLGDWR